jgi:hypothetical protein
MRKIEEESETVGQTSRQDRAIAENGAQGRYFMEALSF